MLTCRLHDPTVASPVAVTLPPAASNLNGPLFPVKLPNTNTTGPRPGSIPNTSPLLKVKAMLARLAGVAFCPMLSSSSPPPQPKTANAPAHTTRASSDHSVCPYVRRRHEWMLSTRPDALWSDIMSPPCKGVNAETSSATLSAHRYHVAGYNACCEPWA